MCEFFSLCSDGNGKPYYFDWKIRKQILSGKIKLESADSHTSIADYYGFKGAKEDELNKWEYNPITRVLNCDKLNVTDDKFFIQKFCEELDFKDIIPQLNIHPIINPFKDRQILKATSNNIKLLKKWASVWDSVGASVWNSVGDSAWASVGVSVWASVWASVGASAWDSVGASVWASVEDSAWASVGDSAWDSVGDSVGASVWNSVGAYVGTFFDIKYKLDISSSNKLWEKGIVPSFDGTLWRLHGHEGKVIYTISAKDLKNLK